MNKKFFSVFILTLVLIVWIFFGYPSIWRSPTNPQNIEKAKAATFSMQTGMYLGNGTDDRAFTNIGFQPDLVMIKGYTTFGDYVLWRSSAMSSEETAKLGEAEADLTSNAIQSFQSTGFTIGTYDDVNKLNYGYYWVAFGGSDCSSSGTFCVGSYTGNGTSQSVNIGFQPDLVVVKGNTTEHGVWKTSSMSASSTNYFGEVNENTGAQMIQSLDATGFTIGNGATVNTSSTTYWYFAFKQVAGAMDVGTYTGDGTDNRDITTSTDSGLTFQPNFVWTKNTSSTTPLPGLFGMTEFFGDRSNGFQNITSLAGGFKKLLSSGGFRIGSNSYMNESGVPFYYAAFGGDSPHQPGSGTFKMSRGSYAGSGATTSISGLGFKPDLVMIKHNDQATDQMAVYKTREMYGARCDVWGNATTWGSVVNVITSLDSDGFSIGNNAAVNTSGDTYYWTAFGNAWDVDTNTGAADFMTGVYYGDGSTVTSSVTRLPFQPDLVGIKKPAIGGAFIWKSSSMPDNQAYYLYGAGVQTALPKLNSDGFDKVLNSTANTYSTPHYFFAFKQGTNMKVGSYTGNGTSQDVTSTVFSPDSMWIKSTTSTAPTYGVLRTSAQIGDAAQPVTAAATITGAITALLSNGFSLGSDLSVNRDTITHYFASWKIPLTFQQAAYKFFENNDGASVGAALAAQDTEAQLSSTGQAFRLRMLVHAALNKVIQSYQNFKLQFAEKSGTCDTSFSGESYSDVTTSSVIAFNDNATPGDGDALTATTTDPTHGGDTIVDQSYEESNNFLNATAAIPDGQDGKWDFALKDNGATASTTYCLRVVKSDGNTLDTYSVIPAITTASAGTLSVDIVDGSGNSVSSPSLAMGSVAFSFPYQTATGTLGVADQKIRVDNSTANAQWTLTLAADGGATTTWSAGSLHYDFNDPTADAGDGADADSYGGQMTVDPSGATITPKSGCNDTGLTLGSSNAFSEGTTNSITLLTAGASAGTSCYWDLTDIGVSQTIPAEQPANSYSLNMTLTVTAN